MILNTDGQTQKWARIRISCHTVHLGDVLLDFLGASIAVHGHLELHGLHQTEHARQMMQQRAY